MFQALRRSGANQGLVAFKKTGCGERTLCIFLFKMGFRFIRRVSVLPGHSLNLSGCGVSRCAGVRGAPWGENRLRLKRAVAGPEFQKSVQNLTKAVDRDAEDLILDALQQKFPKLPGQSLPVFPEELGIKTFPEGTIGSPGCRRLSP
jgi:hypothetical protein